MPSKTFLINVPLLSWKHIQPVKTVHNHKRKGAIEVLVLPKYQWEPEVMELIWDQHKLPCPYTFRKARVSPAMLYCEEYILIDAYCRECGGTATGRILRPPRVGEGVQLIWRATDTRDVKHRKKRPIMRDERDKIGERLYHSSAAIFRRQEGSKLMDWKDEEPPILRSANVLRHVKQENLEKKLQLVRGTCPINNLSTMMSMEPFLGIIREVGVNPVFILYFSPAQLAIYNKCAQEGYVSLKFGATGGIGKNVHRPSGPSGPVMFYEVVVHTGRTQLPVFQFISEAQNANKINYALNEFLRDGALIPNEIVIDDSGALKAAVARSFAGCGDLHDYLDKCFSFLQTKSGKLPQCFIRLDVAHFLKNGAQWALWQSQANKRIKDFYLTCIGLLVMSTSLPQFETILRYVLVLSMSSYEQESGTGLTPKHCFEELKKLIGNGLQLMDNCLANDDPEAEAFKCGESDANEEQEATDQPSKIQEWLCDIYSGIKVEDSDGDLPLNPYYCPDFSKRIMKKLPYFLMWSAALVPCFKSPSLTASSSSVESDYKTIKHLLTQGAQKPLAWDKFVALHIKDIDCLTKLAVNESEEKIQTIGEMRLQMRAHTEKSEDSKDTHHEEKNPKPTKQKQKQEQTVGKNRQKRPRTQKISSSSDDEDIAHTELDVALSNKNLEPPEQMHLRNGNLCGDLPLHGNPVKVKNTCTFDALVHLVTNAYIQYEMYRAFCDELAEDDLFDICKSQAVNGADSTTYQLRASAVSKHMDIRVGTKLRVGAKRRKSKRDTSLILEYDCYGNLTKTARLFLKDYPLAVVQVICSEETCERGATVYPHIELNSEVVFKKGINSLDQSLLRTMKLIIRDEGPSDAKEVRDLAKCRKPCNGKPTVVCKLGNHIFIDTEVLGGRGIPTDSPFNRKYTLSEFPVHLSLLGLSYILVGTVVHRPGHYVAVCRSSNGVWTLYDDTKEDPVKNVDADKKQHDVVFLMYVQN